MFGKNVIRKIHYDPITLDMHSIFYTIQGEGPHAGRPAVFLRLAGCSLACSWCDTEFEAGAIRSSHGWIADRVNAFWPQLARDPLCVITGGEPTRQDLVPLVRMLIARGFSVQVETAGIHCDAGLKALFAHPAFSLVCSPKTPKLHPDIELNCTYYKYIVDADEEKGEDGLPLYAVSQAGRPNKGVLYRPEKPNQCIIYVQPLDIPDDIVRSHRNVQHCAMLAMQRGYRLSLQQHKILELP